MNKYIHILIVVAFMVATYFVTREIYDKPVPQPDTVLVANTALPKSVDSLEIALGDIKNENAKLLVMRGLWKSRYDKIKRELKSVKPDTVIDTLIISNETKIPYTVSHFDLSFYSGHQLAFRAMVDAYCVAPVDSLRPFSPVINKDFYNGIYLTGFEAGKEKANRKDFWYWTKEVGKAGVFLYLGSKL